jgi:LPXTG-motif cell wall-anchored protein
MEGTLGSAAFLGTQGEPVASGVEVSAAANRIAGSDATGTNSGTLAAGVVVGSSAAGTRGADGTETLAETGASTTHLLFGGMAMILLGGLLAIRRKEVAPMRS